MHGRRTITPGRIITADELQAQGLTPKIILRNDFGIAAIKSRRLVGAEAQQEAANLSDPDLDVLHSRQIHYDRDKNVMTVDDGIPTNIGRVVSDTLQGHITDFNCREGRASFFVGCGGYEAHIDQKLMAHLHLSPAFGMVGYSFNCGTIDIIDRADYVNTAQLEERIQNGDAVPEELAQWEGYVFSEGFVHKSNSRVPLDECAAGQKPIERRPLRAIMFLTPKSEI